MIIKQFLRTLFSEFERNKIEYCILRNFNTLPDTLKTGDIDVLILEKDLVKIHKIIENMIDITILGITKRSYVNNYFLYNIEKGSISKALQIDFIYKFVYKGCDYINTKSILSNKYFCSKRELFIANSTDQIFLEFLPYLLSTGTINKKYENEILLEINKNQDSFGKRLMEIGIMNATELISNLKNRNLKKIELFSKEIKKGIFKKNFSIINIFKHNIIELKLRSPFFNQYTISTIIDEQDIKTLKTTYLESFAKNIVFINKNSIKEYLKILIPKSNLSFIIFYKNKKNVNSYENIENEIIKR